MMRIGEMSTREVATVVPGTSVRNAARAMRELNVGDVIVLDCRNGRRIPTGILTDRDIVYELVALDLDAGEVAVDQMMSLELITVYEDADLLEVIHLMGQEGIRRVPVVDADGDLVGIFCMDDAIEQLTSQLEDLLLLVRRQRRPGQTTRVA